VALVDVVIVSYNSRDRLRDSVEPLLPLPDVHVIVVDNASPDNSLEVLEGLAVECVSNPRNGGFAYGCNAGWRRGSAPYVLLLNPDAVIDQDSIARLVAVLEQDAMAGAAVPMIRHEDGSLDHSLRRFPRLRSTYAQAMFLHRLWPGAAWTDEVVRRTEVYTEPASPEWASGACILIRRSSLEALDGLDEGFFLYCEDIDLAYRLHERGERVAYQPAAVVTHVGGTSTPAGWMLPLLAASRVRFARKHRGPLTATLERAGIALGAATHIVVSRGGAVRRRGHVAALRVAILGRSTAV
jgi:GT2 family glycosyltransferase